MASGGGNGESISLMAGQLQELFSLTPFPQDGDLGQGPGSLGCVLA